MISSAVDCLNGDDLFCDVYISVKWALVASAG